MSPLLIVDFDSTFIRDETLDEIANLLLSSNRISKNTQEKITEITNQAMNGELDFKQALKNRVKLLNIHKNDISQVISVLNERVSLSFIQNKEYIQTIAKSIYIISGGFIEIIEPIVKEYGIPKQNIFANEFIYNSNGYINGINEETLLCHSDGKIRAVKTLNLSHGGYVIGDGSTDLEIKAVEGIKAFICFTENVDRKAVSSKADFIASNFHKVIKIINCND
jgi:D-3-phosphoglycerate dehydrogenase